MIRRLLALVALVALGLTVPATANAAPLHESHQSFPTSFPLPNGFLPEGITIGPGPTAYFGSRADGDVYRVDLRTGRGKVFSQGQGVGFPSVGMKSDGRSKLFIAGGNAGTGRVVDLRSGKILASYQFTTEASFVNDVVLTPDAAYFTDSSRPFLYRVPTRGGDAKAIALTGDYVHQPGFNANGIARTPDGRALLIVQSATGLLFRVDPKTGATKTVDLGGFALTNGDGLLVVGRTLYVVQNFSNQVAVLSLDKHGRSGELEKIITDPRFDIPTTVAAFGNRLYLPNARFSTPPTPDTPYSAVAVRR